MVDLFVNAGAHGQNTADDFPDPSYFDNKYHRMPFVFMGFAVSLVMGAALQWAWFSLVDPPEERLRRKRQSNQVGFIVSFVF